MGVWVLLVAFSKPGWKMLPLLGGFVVQERLARSYFGKEVPMIDWFYHPDVRPVVSNGQGYPFRLAVAI